MSFPSVELSRPVRWEEPFGDPPPTDREVDEILSRAPFDRIDESAFPDSLSLRDLLRNDTRINRYVPGDVVFRDGDYGTSAYFILSGRIRVVIQGAPGELAKEIQGTVQHERRGFMEALAQLWTNDRVPEARRYETTESDEHVQSSGLFLQDVPAVLDKFGTAVMEPGNMFGESAALGRTPRNATTFAETGAELLEIRWQGLRDMSRRAPELRELIDTLYRERGLGEHIRLTPIFQHLDETARDQIAEQTTFESYGRRDWTASYQKTAGSTSDLLRNEPIIAEEGHYPNGLILIRSGFARVSQRFGNGHRTLRYLGRGEVFGFDEIYRNWRTREPAAYQYTLRAIGYVDVLLIPSRVVEELVLPTLPEEFLPEAQVELATDAPGRRSEIRTEYLEQLVEGRFINGSATMLIDLERCTGCDDCVRACSATHNGNPRFVRHGPKVGHFMIANACMHCADPVCMIGCPTGSIHRTSLEGQVAINDRTCIGCQTCANNCPYDNIRMVEIRDAKGAPLLDRETLTPIVKATKCDLCVDQAIGPACQNACPHDALKRVDMREIQLLQELLER